MMVVSIDSVPIVRLAWGIIAPGSNVVLQALESRYNEEINNYILRHSNINHQSLFDWTF